MLVQLPRQKTELQVWLGMEVELELERSHLAVFQGFSGSEIQNCLAASLQWPLSLSFHPRVLASSSLLPYSRTPGTLAWCCCICWLEYQSGEGKAEEVGSLIEHTLLDLRVQILHSCRSLKFHRAQGNSCSLRHQLVLEFFRGLYFWSCRFLYSYAWPTLFSQCILFLLSDKPPLIWTMKADLFELDKQLVFLKELISYYMHNLQI